MEATGISPARQTRSQHRHEIHTLTYLTLDDANAGVVRNVSRGGIGAQVLSAVHPNQPLRISFDLRHPRVRVETRGEVAWASFNGQCGIRFVDLPPELTQKISQWIFGDMLERISVHTDPGESMFAEAAEPEVAVLDDPIAAAEEDDGLMVSASPMKVIPLPSHDSDVRSPFLRALASKRELPGRDLRELDWLSQPLSGRGLEWAIHSLVVLAGVLLFVLIFLSVTRDAPPWPISMVSGTAVVIAALYWSFFRIFGGSTLGARLSRLAQGGEQEEESRLPRFR
jgi:PilZ domain